VQEDSGRPYKGQLLKWWWNAWYFERAFFCFFRVWMTVCLPCSSC